MPPTSSSLTDRYLEHLEALKRYSPTTLHINRKWLNLFEVFWGEDELLALSAEDLTDWYQHLTWNPNSQGKLYAENTVNQAVAVIRRFFDWMVCEGLLNENPAGHLKLRASRGRRKYLTMEQRRRLLKEPDLDRPTGIRNRAVIAVILETRISRACCSRIDLADLQLDTGALLTRGRKRKIHCLSEGLLTDLERYLDFARPLLAQAPDPALFLDRFGDRLSGAAIQSMIRSYALGAGVPIP